MGLLTPFQVKSIVIDGKPMRGRPVALDHSPTRDMKKPNGEPIYVTKYETICPHCGHNVSFGAELKEVQCAKCLRGTNVLEDPSQAVEIEVAASTPAVGMPRSVEVTPSTLYPFCNPGEYDQELVLV